GKRRSFCMRSAMCFCVTALFLASLANPWLTSALASNPSAHGDFQVSVGDGVTRDITFNVQTDKRGIASGDITLTDPSAPLDFDPDNPPDNPDDANDSPPGLSLAVAADCLVIDGNRTVMGGVVVDSNAPSHIGRRVLITAETNPDRLTWGIYENATRTWI